MEISPLYLFLLTVSCIALGIALGVLHDLQRLISIMIGCHYSLIDGERIRRLSIPGKGISPMVRQTVIFLQDAVWFVFAAVGIILLNYRLNYGQLRILSIVSFCLGFFLYYATLGRLVLYFNQYIVDILKRITKIFFYILYKPISFFVDLFGKIAKNIFKKITKALAKRRKKVYNEYSQKCIMKRTSEGFLTDELL